MASYASARMFRAAGPRLAAIGALIQGQRDQAEAQRIAEEERKRRTAREDMQTDIMLAGMGGGRGAVPMIEAPSFEAPGVTLNAPAALTLSGKPAKANPLADPAAFSGAIAPPARLEAPSAAAPIRRPDPRYVQVGTDAYIMTPDARAAQEAEARLGVLRQEHAVKQQWEQEDEDRRRRSIASIYLKSTPGATPEEADLYAEKVQYGMVDPTPTPERFSAFPYPDEHGHIVTVGDRGTVRDSGVGFTRPTGGRGGSGDRSSAAFKQERARAVGYVDSLIKGQVATDQAGPMQGQVNARYLRDLINQHFPELAQLGEADAIISDAMRRNKNISMDYRPYKMQAGAPPPPSMDGTAPPPAGPAAPPSPAAPQVDPVAMRKQAVADTVAQMRQQGKSSQEIDAYGRQRGWWR